jgi:hypothetical protein
MNGAEPETEHIRVSLMAQQTPSEEDDLFNSAPFARIFAVGSLKPAAALFTNHDRTHTMIPFSIKAVKKRKVKDLLTRVESPEAAKLDL